jgi:RNA ligase partner protein
MFKQRFVLDTTALTDLQTREVMGYTSLCEGMKEILDLIADARLQFGISCYVPYPSVYKEMYEFTIRNGCDREVIDKIDTWLVKKSPDRYRVDITSQIFHEYVSHMRERIDRGMGVAEDVVWEAATACLSIEYSQSKGKEYREEIEREIIGGIIGKFRNKYRSTLRYGILDSAPDIDVLILAKELDAAVIASDYGIEKWAEQLGVRFVPANTFPMMIKEYLKLLHENESES